MALSEEEELELLELEEEESLAQQEMESPPPTGMESYGRGLLQGAMFDYADEATGGIQAAMDVASGHALPGDFSKQYRQRRDESRRNFDRAAKENPKSFLAGTVTGGVGSAMIPGVGALNAAKGAKLGKSLLLAATQGGLVGAGQAEETENIPVESAKGAVLGGALSAAGAGASRLIPKSMKEPGRLGRAIKKFAEERSFKASGGMKRDFLKANKKENLQELGRTALDEGVVTKFATTDDISNRLVKKVSDATEELDQYIDELSKSGKGKTVSSRGIRDKLVVDLLTENPSTPLEEMQPAIDKIDTWLLNQPENMELKDLQTLKRSFNKFLKDIDFDRNPNQNPMAKTGLLDVRKAVKQNIEKLSDEIGGQPGKVKNMNRRLGNLINLEKMSVDRSSQENANRMFSLGDRAAGIGLGGAGLIGAMDAGQGLSGAGLNALIVGGLAAGGSKLARKYGNSVMATGFDRFADNLATIPRFAELLERNPKAFMNIAQKLFVEVDPNQESEPVPIGVLGGGR